MAEYKAIYIRSTRSRYDRKYYIQHWSYRGHEYMVTMPADGDPSTDFIYGDMKPAAQHRKAQAEIDEMVDNPQPEEPQEQKYEGSAQEGIDLFFNFLQES